MINLHYLLVMLNLTLELVVYIIVVQLMLFLVVHLVVVLHVQEFNKYLHLFYQQLFHLEMYQHTIMVYLSHLMRMISIIVL